MAIQTIPGLTGFTYARVASMDGRAVGKLTDANHLESFHSTEPADYDKKIIYFKEEYEGVTIDV